MVARKFRHFGNRKSPYDILRILGICGGIVMLASTVVTLTSAIVVRPTEIEVQGMIDRQEIIRTRLSDEKFLSLKSQLDRIEIRMNTGKVRK